MENKENNYECPHVTDVKIYPFREGLTIGHVKALATIVISDAFMVRGLRVMEGEQGLFVIYPNDPFYKGEIHRAIVQPITQQFRDHVENVVLEAYQKEMNGKGDQD